MLGSTLLRNSKGSKVSSGDRVFVRYEGQLVGGKVFDRNFIFGEIVAVEGRDLFSFVLGQGQVIQGWDLALNGARLGQVYKLVIPPELAYGNVERPGIPANSVLNFTVELVGFSQGDKAQPIAYELADVGIKLGKYGLSNADLKRVSALKIGLDGDESVDGTAGIDLLTGLGGNNSITGGLGADLLISTKGADQFKYFNIEESQPGKKTRDLIAGFSKNDQIDLSGINSDEDLVFIGKNKFMGMVGELRYEKGVISLDVNGDRKADFELGLLGQPQISESSFIF